MWRVIQRLLWAQYRSSRYLCCSEDIDSLLCGPFAAPPRHPLADQRTVLATLKVIGEARILQPTIFFAHQLRPANEQRVSRDLAKHPAVPGAVDIGGRRCLAKISGRNAVGRDHRLFDQGRVCEGECGRQ
jgi:hypothetical protein